MAQLGPFDLEDRHAALSGRGRRLLGLTYPYPQLFDLSQGGNEIGRADQAGAA